MRISAAFLALCCLSSLSACSSIAYYSQATAGHLGLLIKRRPITELLADGELSEQTRQKLHEVQKIRRFASSSLLLPDNDSYKSFADIKRKYVVWNVFATPELSLTPIESCFVVVGCLSYRGYYAESAAQDFANELRAAGRDVYVGGVAAYSTLGWFDDPVLNTMLYWDNRRLARLIFHELTHQLIYVKNDALFNESLATSFADIGLQRWLEKNAANDGDSSQADKSREIDFIDMILHAQKQLQDLFASKLSNEEKRRDKKLVFNSLQEHYQAFKLRWSGYSGYDDWMSQNLNNAKIASVVTYHSYDKAFQHLLQRVDSDLGRFIEVVKAIAALAPTERHECLTILTRERNHHCDL